jgi:hypothetical protein
MRWSKCAEAQRIGSKLPDAGISAAKRIGAAKIEGLGELCWIAS